MSESERPPLGTVGRRASIFGNVGTPITFRVGAEDAQYLAREFYPVFSEDDFLNLPAHHIYLRMTIDGVASRPFSARTHVEGISEAELAPLGQLLTLPIDNGVLLQLG